MVTMRINLSKMQITNLNLNAPNIQTIDISIDDQKFELLLKAGYRIDKIWCQIDEAGGVCPVG